MEGLGKELCRRAPLAFFLQEWVVTPDMRHEGLSSRRNTRQIGLGGRTAMEPLVRNEVKSWKSVSQRRADGGEP